MNKRAFKKIIGGVGLASAALMLAGNPSPTQTNQSATQNHEIRGITPERRSSRHRIQNTIGGIPLEYYYASEPGLSPKEYGIRYGNGRCRKKVKNKILTSKRTRKWHS